MITQTNSILNLLFAKGLGNVKLGRIIAKAKSLGIAIAEVPSLDDTVLKAEFGLTDKLIEAISDAHAMADETSEALATAGIETLVRGIHPYPKHLITVLGDTAPIVLFAKGNLGVLERKAVGFCGSRNASDKGLAIAADAAEQLAHLDVNVVSGYAKGVDLTAHRNAIKNGGVTTIVLAEGIEHYRPKGEIRDYLNDENHLVLSEFWPRAQWSGRGAMQRNRTIIGLSDAMVCIESGTTGGTHAAADSSLSLNVPLFVTEFANPPESAAGNKEFIDRGASALRGGSNGHPNLKKLLATLGVEAKPPNSAVASEPTQPFAETSRESNATEQEQELESELPKKATPVKEAWESYVGSDPNSLKYPKRLIEVDLPIARISAHARREKSIRHGHISTLHIWWARRPLAACRAVICASLWPDPADPLCPQAFRDAAVKHIRAFAARAASGSLPKDERPKLKEEQAELEAGLSPESRARWEAIAEGALALNPQKPTDMAMLRFCLLDFIADFANWDNSTIPAYLETSRALTLAAHESLGGIPGTKPLVIDPFAGGGSIPLESLRVGADAFASDLNPIPVILNKVVLEYIPKHGAKLLEAFKVWGNWVKERANERLGEYYPANSEGEVPVAYLWSRTILSEVPGQKEDPIELPLLRSFWLAKRPSGNWALRWKRDPNGNIETERVNRTTSDGQTKIVRRPLLEFHQPKSANDMESGTSKGGAATCPISKYTTTVEEVREQLMPRRGGTADARLHCVVTTTATEKSKLYRHASEIDYQAVERVKGAMALLESSSHSKPPAGELNHLRGFFNVVLYGMKEWKDLFSPRQQFSLMTLVELIKDAGAEICKAEGKPFAEALQTCLAMAMDRFVDYGSSSCVWASSGEFVCHTFGRQALPMVWDFAEVNPLAPTGWEGACDWVYRVLEATHRAHLSPGLVEQASATAHPLPNDSADAVITDPPYYAAIPYADLSDYFYSWLKKSLGSVHPKLFSEELSPKSEECVSLSHRAAMYRHKDAAWFEQTMTKACEECRRVNKPTGIAVIVFANKETSGWEAMLAALINSGWVVTASWPIDTERSGRLRAIDSAALASSVHLVCRPREDLNGNLRDDVGEWRDVLSELPKRIHEWMPRLTAEGVIGADAIFACLGPALEVFSKFSRVEKSNGDVATLGEYLEHVWAAVSTEALALIFKDADASGLEPDARLTAMWMWTIGGGSDDGGKREDDGKVKPSDGYTLDFDAARKIAQGLGVHLEQCTSLVEIKGDQAKLLPVSARTRHLFGKDSSRTSSVRLAKEKQRTLFDDLDEAEAVDAGWTPLKGPPPGSTTLDRVHQAMILFAANRGELLKRFLVDDGVGKEARFWKLADNLNKLYPTGTEERRWVEGVLARKRGLGL